MLKNPIRTELPLLPHNPHPKFLEPPEPRTPTITERVHFLICAASERCKSRDCAVAVTCLLLSHDDPTTATRRT